MKQYNARTRCLIQGCVYQPYRLRDMKLHTHPGMEKRLGLDDKHVIVDRFIGPCISCGNDMICLNNEMRGLLCNKCSVEKVLANSEDLKTKPSDYQEVHKRLINFWEKAEESGQLTNRVGAIWIRDDIIAIVDSELDRVREETRKECQEAYELRGAGKMLDYLWNNSYYSMGKLGSDRIREEMEYYFGKNWTTDMYKFIGEDKGVRHNGIKTLKELQATTALTQLAKNNK